MSRMVRKRLPRLLVASESAAVFDAVREAAHAVMPAAQILEVMDGQGCLHSLSNDHIDAAFIEVNLPGPISGLEALALARESGRTLFTTLIAANPVPELADVARTLNVYDLLIKPVVPDHVQHVLNASSRIAQTLRLLVVDDSKAVRKIIRKVLDTSMFRLDIHEADDGETALKMLSAEEFDIALVDYQMTGINGIQTLERIMSASAAVKVIIISARRSKKLAQLALDRGAIAFLSKPFFGRDIDIAIRTLFGIQPPRLWQQRKAVR